MIPRLPPVLIWRGGSGGALCLLDQTLLPHRVRYCVCRTAEDAREAIRRLAVRGAPAIGCAAAYAMVLGLRRSKAHGRDGLRRAAETLSARVRSSRPTAVNLGWAVERVRAAVSRSGTGTAAAAAAVALREAHAIMQEERARCEAIGRAGARLLRNGSNVLTHCNAGALATPGLGTALAPIYLAARRGRRLHVWVDETRPVLQGARLTMWELMRARVPATLVTDSMAACLMRAGRVDLVLVGADRIAANGDTANKIGTYGVALLARAHGIPVYVAAPASTFDLAIPAGNRIPIEERPENEITAPGGHRWAPAGARAFNPAFDVTPANLITAFITDRGILFPPYPTSIRNALKNKTG
jgi:methylthioribose-1-phosphate isomerase